MFSRSCCVRASAWGEPGAVAENLRQDFGADASGHGGDLIHARTGLRDALLRTGCRAGPGLHAHGMVLSFLWDVSGLAGCCAHRKRHFVERALRKFAAHYIATT